MAGTAVLKRVLIVGGVAGGASCAARLRRLSESVKITIFEKGHAVSFANVRDPARRAASGSGAPGPLRPSVAARRCSQRQQCTWPCMLHAAKSILPSPQPALALLLGMQCGLPYHVGGVIPEESSLLVANAAKFNNW